MAEAWQTFIAGLGAIQAYTTLLVLVTGFLVAEYFFPAERGQSLRARILTGEFTLVYFVLTPLVVMLPMGFAAAIAQATGGSLFSFDLDRLATGSPELDWTLRNLALPFVPFIVFDFFYYWHHRLQHTWPAFWEQHKLHHTDESVYCLSSGRHHWLEEGIRVLTISIPMAVVVTLGAVKGVWMAVVLAYWPIVIHANVRLPFGPFTPMVTGPQFHRIHHSRQPAHANKNFAAYIPMWDMLFGTYYRPARDEWPATGIASRETVNSLWTAATMPFRVWGSALLTRARKGGSAVIRAFRG